MPGTVDPEPGRARPGGGRDGPGHRGSGCAAPAAARGRSEREENLPEPGAGPEIKLAGARSRAESPTGPEPAGCGALARGPEGRCCRGGDFRMGILSESQ